MFKAIRVSVLILVLTCSAQAGYMPNGLEEPPPPPPAPVTAYEEPTAQDQTPDDTSVVIIEAALSVLNSVLALL
jgi:hypothetical protein